ncbi:NYN domain-containing protein [Nocardioides taihuensis]|uniref:NYN domain-containing protein n=1 Tax=Nocardioides taihuensis TaxID=1835606 RepID=A0ABW0BL11_9ACTN
MPEPADARLAVLIDADNTSARHADALLEELARYGVPTVKRAYGDWTTQNLVKWKAELNRHAIQPVQQFAYTTGKNSTDSALIIDAMDLLYTGRLDAFAIVSSDSDFTRLATRLRESGVTVYGLGQRKTPESFRAACDTFIYLEVIGSGPAESDDDAGSDEPAPPPLPDLRRLLTRAVNQTSGDDGWASMSTVGNYLAKVNASFDPRNYGSAKLSTLAKAQDYLEVKGGTGSAPMRVRLKPAKQTSRTSATKKAAKKAEAQRS